VKGIKKPLIPVILILGSLITGFLITSIIYTTTGFSIFGRAPRATVPVQEAENVEITLLAYRVLEYIRDDDFISLSHVVHPDYGVLLSPYATIDLTTDRRFAADEIAVLISDNTVYVWGVFNGSGEPIKLTPAEYFEVFVPAAEHIDATLIGINQVVRSGNALENLTDVFPSASFVDFHIPARDSSDEPDWRSLRLAFEEYEGYYKLIAIVYNKWTI